MNKNEILDAVVNDMSSTLLNGDYLSFIDVCVEQPLDEQFEYKMVVWGEDNDMDDKFFSVAVYRTKNDEQLFSLFSESNSMRDLKDAVTEALKRYETMTLKTEKTSEQAPPESNPPQAEVDYCKEGVREQAFNLWDFGWLTDQQLNLVDFYIDDVVKDYLERCDAWEQKNGEAAPLSVELECVDQAINNVAQKYLGLEKEKKSCLMEQISAAKEREQNLIANKSVPVREPERV